VANGFSGHAATTTDVDTGNLSSDCPPEHPARDLIVFRCCLRIGATVYLPTNWVSPARTPHRVCFPDLQTTRCSDGLVCCEMHLLPFPYPFSPILSGHTQTFSAGTNFSPPSTTIYIIYTRYCLQNPSTIETFQIVPSCNVYAFIYFFSRFIRRNER